MQEEEETESEWGQRAGTQEGAGRGRKRTILAPAKAAAHKAGFQAARRNNEGD